MKKGVFAVIFIALMCVMGGVSIVTFLKLHWPESIPEGKEEKMEIPAVETVNRPQSSGGLLKTVEYAKAGVEAYTKNVNPLSNSFLFFYAWLNEATQGDIILKGTEIICRLSNGYYTLPFTYSRSEESLNELLNFTTWLNQRDIKYFQLITAEKGDDSFGTLPKGAPDGYARMAEENKVFLDDNGIDYLEAKPKLLAQNSDFYYWFYKADHHWNVYAGLLLARECAKKLNEIGVAVDTNVVKKENFKLVVYPDSFLGSLGRALGHNHTEDMEVYYPTVETSFHLWVPSLEMDMTGSFENTLIAGRYLKSESRSYSAFLYGDLPLIRIENLLSGNTTRVLVIKHSKANILCPYLAMTARYLDMIDLRHFDGSIRSFIEQTKPDIVIACLM